MWLFIWKKYEYSAVATGVSMLGNIGIVFAAILLAMWLASVNIVLGIAAGIAGYVLLRVLLNKLTDRIAAVSLNASVAHNQRKDAREAARQKVKDAELMKAMAEETDQDALYKAVHDSFHLISFHSEITLDQKFAAAQRLDDEHLKKLVETCKGCFNYNRSVQKRCVEKGEPVNEGTVKSMTRLISFIRDEGVREQLMQYYYLK